MFSRQTRRWPLLALLMLVLAATSASAATTTYAVRGTGGAVWAVGDQPGTEFVAFTFSELAPQPAGAVPPGPRLTFSLVRWALVDNAFVRRQWYGDVALKPEDMVLGADLVQATLDVEVMGSLEERTVTGVVVRRDVPGRVQMRWSPSSGLGILTTSYIYQTPAYLVTLQTTGQGRSATTAATVTVAELGGVIHVAGFGSLSGTTIGNMVVAAQ